MIIVKSKSNEYLKNGKPVFVYALTSNLTDAAKAKAELEAYKAKQGSNYRENEVNEPLLFSGRVAQPNSPVTINKDGDYTIQGELRDLVALAEELEQGAQNIQKARAQMERALGKKLTEDQLFSLALKMATA